MNSELFISLIAVVATGLVWLCGMLHNRRVAVHRSFLAFTGGLSFWAFSELVRCFPHLEALHRVFAAIQSVAWPVIGILALHFVCTWLNKQKGPIYLIFLSSSLISVPLWLFSPWLQIDIASFRWGIPYGIMVILSLTLPAGVALSMLYGRYLKEENERCKNQLRSLVVGITALVTMSLVVGIMKASYLIAPMIILTTIGTYGSMFFNRFADNHSFYQAKSLTVLPNHPAQNMAGGESRFLAERLHHSQKMEALGRLAGGVAHDFNNLLSAILGYAGIIEESLDPADELQEDARELLVAARRAASLTRQLLAFSRRETNEPTVMSLNEVVSNMEKMLRRVIGEDIVLITELADDPWLVEIDQGQIDQVLVNLVVNARDAMPVGGRLTIETANLNADMTRELLGLDMPPGRYVCLRVQDNGIGIPSDVVERIFEPFVSTKPFGKGTGLGLSTVYGIVKQAGGEIKVRSKAGEGACFDLFFPAAGDDGVRESQAEVPKSYALGTETVLLVEDDRAVRSLTSRILAGKGYTVLEAESGEKAVELAEKHLGPIHLLLTDVIMPGMNGKQCADLVLASRADTRVMFMSGYTDDVLANNGLLDKRLDLLEKPIDAEELLSRLAEVLHVSDN